MWKNYLSNMIKDCQFKAPATEKEIFSIKKELNTDLPKKLTEIYNETNGVDGEYYSYIWSTVQMVEVIASSLESLLMDGMIREFLFK